MLRVERFVKCRTMSGSPNSGKSGAESAKASRGNNSSHGVAGTSLLGRTWPRRPGFDCSNIVRVARVLRMESSNWGERISNAGGKLVDLLLSPFFSHRHQKTIL